MRATNATVMKADNKKLILSGIRKSMLSRVELSNTTGLTRAAVSMIVDDLLQNKIIAEEKTIVNGVGRPRTILQLNKDAYYAIGIDISRDHFSVGIVNFIGEVLCEEIYPNQEKEETISQIILLIHKQIKKQKITREKICGIGITCPGPVDYKKREILNPPNFDSWHYELIGERIEEETGILTYLENVSNASALCEKCYGVAKNSVCFLSIIVDDGIGSGIVIGDKIFRGTNELGHTSINFAGPKCQCGNTGCLEKYASIPAILAQTPYQTWKQVVESDNLELIQKEAMFLGSAIANANNLFDFEMIVINGDICYKSESLIEYLKEDIHAKTITKKNVRVINSSVNSRALRAGSVVLNHCFL